MRPLFFLSLICLVHAAYAHTPSDGDIHASVGPFTYMTHAQHTRFRQPILIGEGLLAEADLDHNGGLEVSLFYLRNPFAVEENGKLYVEQLKRMYISTGYRHWFNPRWSAAVGFSSSYAIGDGRVINDEFGGAPHESTSAEDITEYGFDFSVQNEFWQLGRFSAIADARYGWSVTPKRAEDSNHFGVFVALKYFVQSRKEIPSGP